MSLTVTCPNCGNSLKASAEHVGRRAKCPRCGASITLAASKRQETSGPKQSVPAKRSPADSGPPTSEGRNPTGRPNGEAPAKSSQPRKYSRSHIVVTSFIALVAGYVGGSFHPMDKMLGEFAEAGKSFTDSYRMPAGDFLQDIPDTSDLDDPTQRFGDGIPLAPDDLLKGLEAVSLLAIGDAYAAEGFSIAMTDARFAASDAETTSGEGTSPTGEVHLVCNFLITNTDDRKSLSLHGSGTFDSRHFTIFESAGSHIHDIEFGISAEAATREDDIPPGEQRTYVAHFIFPRPAAGDLILSLDLKAFGGTGRIRFMIPASASGESPPDGS